MLFDNQFRQTIVVLNNWAVFLKVDSQKISRCRASFILEPFLFFHNPLLTFAFLQILILTLGSVGVKLETKLFNLSYIDQKSPLE